MANINAKEIGKTFVKGVKKIWKPLVGVAGVAVAAVGTYMLGKTDDDTDRNEAADENLLAEECGTEEETTEEEEVNEEESEDEADAE